MHDDKVERLLATLGLQQHLLEDRPVVFQSRCTRLLEDLRKSDPRSPDQPQIIEWIYETGFCGFYFRVLTPGTVTAGDAIEPLSRGDAELTVARVLGALFSRGSAAALLERLAAYEPAASNLRAWAKRALRGDEEGDDA